LAESILIYGATGYTGGLLARAARQIGIPVALCGRDAKKIEKIASKLGAPFHVAGVQDSDALDRALSGARVVLNAAGPFATTAPSLIQACLRAGVHYLDVTGEVSVIDAATRVDGAAKQRNIMVMPAVGFDVVPSDCLAAHLAGRVDAPARLSIGIAGLELLTRGSARTIINQLAEPTWVRRGGRLNQVPAGSLEHSFDYGRGMCKSIGVSWGDVASAYFTTGVPDISVYFEATPAVRVHHALLGLYGWTVPMTPWRQWLSTISEWLPDGPSEAERARHGAVIVAEMEDATGAVTRARMRTPEAYTMTVATAIAIARRVAAGDFEPGFQTPGRVYGPDFPLSLPDVAREDF
jgi:short subunit dehydrogenase-like uncharacterized protein